MPAVPPSLLHSSNPRSTRQPGNDANNWDVSGILNNKTRPLFVLYWLRAAGELIR